LCAYTLLHPVVHPIVCHSDACVHFRNAMCQ